MTALKLGLKRIDRQTAFFAPCLALAFIALFGMFNANWFGTADADWFNNFQIDSENNVYGRLAEARHEGLFSNGGLLGRYYTEGEASNVQTGLLQQIYVNGIPDDVEWTEYQPSIGIQGYIYGLIDKLLPSRADGNLHFFHAITSLMNAAIFSALLFWIGSELGVAAFIGAFFVCFYSPWLIVFGRNMFFMIGLHFLPMLIIAFGLRRAHRDKKFDIRWMFAAYFCTYFIKAGTGYEFLNTIVLAAWVPMIFYALRDGWSFRRFAKLTLTMGFTSVAAFLLALTVNAQMLANYMQWNMSTAFTSILGHAAIRLGIHTDLGADIVAQSATEDPNAFNVTIPEVLDVYFRSFAESAHMYTGTFFQWPPSFGVLVVFGIVLCFFALLIRQYEGRTPYTQRLMIQIVMLGAALVASMAWVMVARQHSIIHTHICPVLWHLPFVFFLAAFAGDVLLGGFGRKFLPQNLSNGKPTSKKARVKMRVRTSTRPRIRRRAPGGTLSR